MLTRKSRSKVLFVFLAITIKLSMCDEADTFEVDEPSVRFSFVDYFLGDDVNNDLTNDTEEDQTLVIE